MKVEIKVPSPGESITEVQISKWLKQDGDFVEKDEEIAEIDSDKATLTISAEESGTLSIKVQEGETVRVGAVACTIDTEGDSKQSSSKSEEKKEKVDENAKEKTASEKKDEKENGKVKEEGASEKKSEKNDEKVKEEAATGKNQDSGKEYAAGTPSPAAGKLMAESKISKEQVKATGKDGRITKGDVLSAMSDSTKQNGDSKTTKKSQPGERNQRREKMSMLRKKISQRLVTVKNETAMLTTFNEVDMSAIMQIRKKYKDKFKEVHGVGLGFMSFFTKAICVALKESPSLNAMIDGDEMIFHDYCDIGIAVSAPKGLMVPVIRNAETLSMAQIESEIISLATKARDGKITIDEMTGGTFTITNGGVFGSMLSTPIINPPQSAILGMHNIVERPVAIDGKIEIRPIMYVALSYDHRIIDGRESVGFLVKVKEMLEDPARMMYEGNDPMKLLLNV